MEEPEGVVRLFFELSSESRVAILKELEKNDLKMNDLARRLNLTATEAFRQLQRLNEAKLIQKQPDASYSTTQYGRLVLQLSQSFEFASKFRETLITRDLFSLPIQFIERLGELSDTEFTMDTVENFNLAEDAIGNAEDYIWWLGHKPTDALWAKIGDAAKRGVKVRCIVKEDILKQGNSLLQLFRGLEMRTLNDVPVVILSNEKSAGVNLLSLDGRTDYALFHGRDPKIRRFADDLFTYYWNQGKL